MKFDRNTLGHFLGYEDWPRRLYYVPNCYRWLIVFCSFFVYNGWIVVNRLVWYMAGIHVIFYAKRASQTYQKNLCTNVPFVIHLQN
jgi:type II secretory pathway component PulF